MDPQFLTFDQIVALHEKGIERFGGSPGLRDQGLLESALEMPRSGYSGVYFHQTIYEKAAAYIFHLVKNHPFVDGNKRIGLSAAVVFLRLNNLKLTLSNQAAYELTMRIASDDISKTEIAKLFEENSELWEAQL